MHTFEKVTIRVAGIAKRIKENIPPPHWRCRINDDETDYVINKPLIIGQVNEDNLVFETNPHAKEGDIVAWVRIYGDITIDDNLNAIITPRSDF